MHYLDLKLGDQKEVETTLPHVLNNFLFLEDQDEICLLVSQQKICTTPGLLLLVMTSNWGEELWIEMDGHFEPLPFRQRCQLVHFVLFYLHYSLDKFRLHFDAWEDEDYEDFLRFQGRRKWSSDPFPPEGYTDLPLLSILAAEIAREGNLITADTSPMSSETTTAIVEPHRPHGKPGRVYLPVANKPVPVRKTIPGLDFYPATTTDLDSSDLFLDYRHGPDEPQELKQSNQPLFISVFGNFDLFSTDTERDTAHAVFDLFYSYFPGNFGTYFVPLKMGSKSQFYSLKIGVNLLDISAQINSINLDLSGFNFGLFLADCNLDFSPGLSLGRFSKAIKTALCLDVVKRKASDLHHKFEREGLQDIDHHSGCPLSFCNFPGLILSALLPWLRS